MAYPTVNAPYGFIPVKRVDGMPFAGAMRSYKIASSYGTNILLGDLVIVNTNGTLEKFTGTTTGSPIGVFMGVSYTNPVTKQPTWDQMWPAGTNASDAMAMVIDDPMVAYRVAVTGSNSAMSSAKRSSIGANVAVVQGTGSTAMKTSGMSVLAGSEATTAAIPIRIIDVVQDTATGADDFPEVIVKINLSQVTNTTGV